MTCTGGGGLVQRGGVLSGVGLEEGPPRTRGRGSRCRLTASRIGFETSGVKARSRLPVGVIAIAIAVALAPFVTAVGASAGQVGSAVLHNPAGAAAGFAEAGRNVRQRVADRTPTWSQPECRQPETPTSIICITEFEHAGVWRSVSASVTNGTLTLEAARQWARRWQLEPHNCGLVAGQVYTNDGGCYAEMLDQNFGGHGTVSYTGFKRDLYSYGTFSALWPDFNGYSCTWSNQTYQCTNRFGDGLRWKPYAQSRQALSASSPRAAISVRDGRRRHTAGVRCLYHAQPAGGRKLARQRPCQHLPAPGSKVQCSAW